MIAHVSGRLIHKTPESVIVDVGGVGYEVFVPLSTFYELPELDDAVDLRIYTHHKDDAIHLYGFLTAREKELFQLLIGVSGVGPRLARNILSGIAVEDLAGSIAGSDKAALSRIPGVGAKSAERLILELKDKVQALAPAPAEASAGEGAARGDRVSDDAVSALVNLGYKPARAEEAVKKASESTGDGAGFEELFKEALKTLSRKK